MRLAGIDLSTRFIDIVTLPLNGEGAEGALWRRFAIDDPRDDDLRAFRATRRVPVALAQFDWTDVELAYVEAVWNRAYDVLKKLARIQGAVIASIPASVAIIDETASTEWKQACGLPANATKDECMAQALTLGFDTGEAMPQDGADAFLVAVGMRTLLNLAAGRVA